jgi:hypothetical protein
MRRFRVLMIAIVLLAATSLALAGPTATDQSKRPRSTADVVSVRVAPAELTAEPGGEVSFKVEMDIADTWHLYDHSYAEDPESFFIGVDLMPGEGANLAGFQATFPRGEEGEFMGEKVVMLHHHAVIEVSVKLPHDTSGEISIPFVLSTQACDDKICLQPSDVPVTAHVTVE